MDSIDIFLKRVFWRRLFGSAVLMTFLIIGVTSRAYGDDRLTLYFYSPEINITRNEVLKNTFDQYLEGLGPLRFQPVDSRDTFESLVEQNENAIFIMSSWHFDQLERQMASLVPRLRGLKNGSETYRKILFGEKGRVDLGGITVATSGTEDYSRSVLKEMFPNQPQEIFSKLRLLIVPKDIDALMAVGFGLADAAMATERSLTKLSTLYKNQYQQLHILRESKPLKRLVVAHGQKASPHFDQAIKILLQMRQSENGRRGLHMLGLDDWQQVEEKPLKGRGPMQK